MPILDREITMGKKVLTPHGPGKIEGKLVGGLIKIDLDDHIAFFKRGQITLDTDFIVLRVINTDHGYLSSAASYASWQEAVMDVNNHPYSEDETWQAINLKTGETWLNRKMGPSDHFIFEAAFDRHLWTKYMVFDDLSSAVEQWEKESDALSGTIDILLITLLMSFKNEEWRLLGYSLYSSMEVIRRKNFYEKKS